ncbi:hypothetical protein D1B31_00740 [Neobacillus notoginsengisoli]|uniref:Spore coat protein n=1 Tax=Neobacillus notoginsengisoli TaxID=1578198 RepID=A0A417YZW9_9BACI|nr:hypothetical protein [Neobacillus notoginsengisoli]RHW43238.1 hypothetical protein D1B31_00740 [Neobacillus notoginsengisoli]
MDKQKNGPKPMLYIVQPDFPRGSLQMQDHFIWRKRKGKKSAEDRTDIQPQSSEADKQTEVIAALELSSQTELVKAEDNLVQELPQAELEIEEEVTAIKEQEASLMATSMIEVEIAGHEDGSLQLDASTEEKVADEPIAMADGDQEEEKKQVQSALVQYFLKRMNEKNIQPVDTLATAPEEMEEASPILDSAPPPKQETTVSDEEARKIWRTVTRLARYPHFLERPQVTAVVGGETMTFQVESKRGDKIRIKTGNKMSIIPIEEISDIQIQF